MVPQRFKGAFCLVALIIMATVFSRLVVAQDPTVPVVPPRVIVSKPIPEHKEDANVLMYDALTNQSDRGFIENMKQGAARAHDELGVDYKDVRISEDGERLDKLQQALDQGAQNIVAVGFQYVVPVLRLAEAHPEVKFTVIDGVVPPIFANVQSVLFKDNEGAFLVGMIAAQSTKTGTIGFVGGLDVPLIRNFAYGYMQGAQYINPKIVVKVDMVGTDKTAWANPDKAYSLALKQFDAGVDVVFAAAGGSGLGVLKAAHDKEKFAIGVDSNQNGLYPGSVLTSMVKRVDKAVFDTLKSLNDGNWKPGIKYLGINEAALDYAIDNNNRDLITSDMINKVENTKDLIIRGMIDVQVYSPE